MKQDDIEKILQQYGADRRQQQQVSDSLHSMARRQKQRVLLACTVVLVAASVWTLHQLTPLQQSEQIIVAQKDIHTQPQPQDQTSIQQITRDISYHNTKRYTTTPSTSLPLTESTQEGGITPYEIAAQEPSVIETEWQSENTEINRTDEPASKEPTYPVINQNDNPSILFADNTVSTPSEDESRHLRFTASVGASTFSRIGTGYTNITNSSDGLLPVNDEASYTQVTPNATFAANIGVSYSIPMGGKQGLELGVGLSGYSHQSEVTTYNTESANTINGTTTVILESAPAPFYLFSLYANLPLTFNFKSKDMKDIGWSLSVTPSHSLVSSRPPGALATNRPLLNPWRLTMGIGLTFPHGLFRSVSLTANLLSLYTSSSYHEIGIEIGF
ncbi:MAG: hypothetical protein J5848_01380 [Bacteroidales bacterium]|nr:hypothetical protein [Bacteroidales bacterium]